MHPAHHYRIHLWDAERAENALASAALCGQTSPGIAHMWHMPGHIYSKTKRYDDACWQQEASARVDHAHMMRDRVLPDQIHNFAHNNEWLIRDLIFVGRMRDAIDLAKNMCELPRHPKYNTLTKGSANFGRDAAVRSADAVRAVGRADRPVRHALPGADRQRRRAGQAAAAPGHGLLSPRRCGARATFSSRLLEASCAEQKAAQEKAVAEAENEGQGREARTRRRSRRPRPTRRKPTEQKINNLTKAVDELKGHKAVAAGDYQGRAGAAQEGRRRRSGLSGLGAIPGRRNRQGARSGPRRTFARARTK